MKKLIQTTAVLFAFLLLSCSDDNSSNNNNAINEITEEFKEGTWHISLYAEDLDDQTSHFTGYNFTFGDNNVLTATDGTNTYTGFWSVTNDSSNDDGPNDVDVNISFTSPADFAELSEDWHIEDRGSVAIYLGHTSGGDGSVDTLIFTKNN